MRTITPTISEEKKQIQRQIQGQVQGQVRSTSQSCPRAKTPRHDGNEPAPSGHELKLSSPTQASETAKTRGTSVTGGPETQAPKISWAERLSIPPPSHTHIAIFPPLPTTPTHNSPTDQLPVKSNFATTVQVREMIDDIARTLRHEMRTLVDEMARSLREELHQLKGELQQDRQQFKNDMQHDRQQLKQELQQYRQEFQEELKNTLQSMFVDLAKELKQQIRDENQTIPYANTHSRSRTNTQDTREDARVHPYTRPHPQTSTQ